MNKRLIRDFILFLFLTNKKRGTHANQMLRAVNRNQKLKLYKPESSSALTLEMIFQQWYWVILQTTPIYSKLKTAFINRPLWINIVKLKKNQPQSGDNRIKRKATCPLF